MGFDPFSHPVSDHELNDPEASKFIHHKRIMYQIYFGLTQKQSPGLVGKQWQDIGFQGNDPRTDVRGSGMLGVLLLLYLIEKFPVSIQEVWIISQRIENQFPLATKVLELSSFIVKALIGYGESNQGLFGYFNQKGEVYQSLF